MYPELCLVRPTKAACILCISQYDLVYGLVNNFLSTICELLDCDVCQDRIVLMRLERSDGRQILDIFYLQPSLLV